MDADEPFVAGSIIYEVLRGRRTPQEFDARRELLGALPFLPTHGATWTGAAGTAAGLRRRGVTLPLPDILLATLARDNQMLDLVTRSAFRLHPGVRLFHPPSRKPGRHPA